MYHITIKILFTKLIEIIFDFFVFFLKDYLLFAITWAALDTIFHSTLVPNKNSDWLFEYIYFFLTTLIGFVFLKTYSP